MDPVQQWLLQFLEPGQTTLSDRKMRLFQALTADGDVMAGAQQILDIQKKMMDKWQLMNRIDEIQQLSIPIPNGTVGKNYEAPINFLKLGLNDIIFSEFSGLEETGLHYDNEQEKILGSPTVSGDIKIALRFRVDGEAGDSILHEKKMTLVINPDPKSLWKNIPSDPDGQFAKPDDVHVSGVLGAKHIVVASRRGRSHANVGSYREDDFAFKHFAENGWSVVAVSDGAGSAPMARQGSKVATEAVLAWFEQQEGISTFDDIITDYKNGTGEDTQRRLNVFIYNTLSQAALFVHKRLAEMAVSYEKPLKDFNATLIFTLFKKYEFGYAVLSFGVGDCPIAMLNPDMSDIMLMNWLDVGEFGGGTRFITMPEIFTSEKFATRFKFKLVDDFKYLMLMTDGIYDPKFVVEANLEKIDNWRNFVADLEGNNPDNNKVEFSPDNPDIAHQLAAWMDFWSSGNHDDRTLAIIF